ncbi:MAG TPA: hypothetical protein VHT05_00500 [Candidatus Elarobacter sp.]|nr:hypothetical protein [Candidatus Elarobacter sp.]
MSLNDKVAQVFHADQTSNFEMALGIAREANVADVETEPCNDVGYAENYARVATLRLLEAYAEYRLGNDDALADYEIAQTRFGQCANATNAVFPATRTKCRRTKTVLQGYQGDVALSLDALKAYSQ